MFSGDRKVSFHLKLSLIHVGLREIILRYTKNNTFLVNIIDNVMLFFLFLQNVMGCTPVTWGECSR